MNIYSNIYHRFTLITNLIVYQFLLGKSIITNIKHKQVYLWRRVDFVFFQSYQKLKSYTKFLLVFHMFKIIISILIIGIIIIKSFKQKQVLSYQQLILILNIICLDGMKAAQNYLALQMFKDWRIFLDVAQQLNHCQYITDQMYYDSIPFNIQSSVNYAIRDFHPILNARRSRFKVMRSIKYCYYVKSQNLMVLEVVTSILYQGYGILSVYIIKFYIYPPNVSNILVHNYLIFITLFCWYLPYGKTIILIIAQVICFSLLIILIIILTPFVSIYQLWKYVKNKIQERRKKKIIQKFLPIVFQDTKIDEVFQCKICMEVIVNLDLIITLPCNESHVFHKQCIQTWWRKTKFNCPYCRESYEQVKNELNEYFKILN